MATKQAQIKNIKELAKQELARQDLLEFVKYRFPDYSTNWHHVLVSKYLMMIESGEIKRLMIFCPPRHGKSELASVNFPAWAMGRNKNRNIITASYNATLAQSFGRKVRNIMEEAPYKRVFDTRLAEDSQAKGTWNTNGKGEYNATGVGGSLTGKGADILLIDDPVKNREEADSEVVSQAVWDWYKSTARTRLSPKGAVVVIMTRWKDDDLAGRILTEGGEAWTVLQLPAVAEHSSPYRTEGQPLWANHFTKEVLEETKRAIGSYEFASQYQQNPINEETQVFKEKMFKYKTMEEVLAQPTTCYVTIDSQGAKEGKQKKGDFTGVTINWVNSDNVWHFKSYRVKVGPTGLLQLIFDLHEAYHPEAIGLESTLYTDAIQPFLTIEMAKKNIFPRVVELHHKGNAKMTRIKWLLPRYERGHIFHIKDMCGDLEGELIRFPASAHDDTMDSAAYQTQIAAAPYQSLEDHELPEETKPLFEDIGV